MSDAENHRQKTSNSVFEKTCIEIRGCAVEVQHLPVCG
jgi:hypothetical protein